MSGPRLQATDERMEPELKAKWVAALRSDDYVQGRGYLHQNGRFCCLGVLAAVCGHSVQALDGQKVLSFVDGSLSAALGDCENRVKLENMNDGANGEAHRDFFEIAEWIEANL